MTKIQKIKVLFLIFIFGLLSAGPVLAARLYFEPAEQSGGLGRLFSVRVMFDAQGEEINALASQIVYRPDLLELVSLREANSIINLWVEKPVADCQDNFCQINFSGIIPGGFSGTLLPYSSLLNPGQVLELIFKSHQPGSGLVSFQNGQALLNDGQGTGVQLTLEPLTYIITAEPAEGAEEFAEDAVSPQPFSVIIASNADIFDGRYFAAFFSQDKETGIAYYEVWESRRPIKKSAEADWQRVSSPYLLEDQDLRSYVYVKAVDQAGNETLSVHEPLRPVQWLEKYLIWIIMIIVPLSLFLISLYGGRRTKRRS
jgi:hypothetical protein